MNFIGIPKESLNLSFLANLHKLGRQLQSGTLIKAAKIKAGLY
jgi:hypothetical protein